MPEYICPAHTNITDQVDKDGKSLSRYSAVTWQGKGCTGCKNEHDKRMAKQELERKKRAARRAGEKYEPDKEEEKEYA